MRVSYVFTAYINLSVHNRQVLRLTYRIHTHIHYIISYQELITYRTKTLSPLSPLSNIPCLCIVASYTAIYIPLILVCGSVPRSHRGKLFQYVIYRFVLPTLQTYGVFDYVVYFINIHYKLNLFLAKSIQFIYIF